MQEGMRIKSKDIIFFNSIFYLAINLFIDIFLINQKLNLFEMWLSNVLVYLVALKIERACKYPTGKLMTN